MVLDLPSYGSRAGALVEDEFFFLSFSGFCQYKGNSNHDREVEKGLACNSSETRHWKGRGMKPRSANVGISDRQIQTLFKVVRPELFIKVTVLLKWGRIESQMYLNISAPLFSVFLNLTSLLKDKLFVPKAVAS